VVALDISNGCLERARIRAERFEVTYELVRGDAENLPFRDESFDYAFVHDGLHHLPKPELAISEMARVARRGIVITEPADAMVTNLLITSNLMKPYEEAGNYVRRFNPQQLATLSLSLGFDRVASSRYLLKYGHPPAGWWRYLDKEPLFQAARATFLSFGSTLFGRWGNKLAFVAERSNGSARSQQAS
jgi:SAM-dependent methyltransferase